MGILKQMEKILIIKNQFNFVLNYLKMKHGKDESNNPKGLKKLKNECEKKNYQNKLKQKFFQNIFQKIQILIEKYKEQILKYM